MNPTARRFVGIAALVATFLMGSATAGSRAARKSDDQPEMAAALKSLKSARTQLKSATPDKGGHCVKAIKDIDRAIAEVERGIDYVRNN